MKTIWLVSQLNNDINYVDHSRFLEDKIWYSTTSKDQAIEYCANNLKYLRLGWHWYLVHLTLNTEKESVLEVLRINDLGEYCDTFGKSLARQSQSVQTDAFTCAFCEETPLDCVCFDQDSCQQCDQCQHCITCQDNGYHELCWCKSCKWCGATDCNCAEEDNSCECSHTNDLIAVEKITQQLKELTGFYERVLTRIHSLEKTMECLDQAVQEQTRQMTLKKTPPPEPSNPSRDGAPPKKKKK
jgi:hypothetical protein